MLESFTVHLITLPKDVELVVQTLLYVALTALLSNNLL
jgi:hypothetical protein